MAKETTTNTGECPGTIQELLNEMKSGRYKHLQVILNRNDNRGLGLGQEYLTVSRNGFGLYRLQDINYSAGTIQLELKSMTSDELACVSMDINAQHPKYYLLSWEDIKQMVYAEDIRYETDADIWDFQNDTQP